MEFSVSFILNYILLEFLYYAGASHFRGGTISWTHVGNNKVRFFFKLGWTHGDGPGCTSAKLGQLVTGMSSSYWNCVNGCGGSSVQLNNVNYICTGASVTENYEQGERTFTYIFNGNGPFTVSFTGGDWISLSDGKGGSWNIATTINLGLRSDTRSTNNSPLSVSKPVYIVQYNCMETLSIPVIDIDGDNVRCRWANSNECGGICNGVPLGVLDPATCKITFPANHTRNGWFGVAITVEDYPKKTITLGGNAYAPSQALSSVPLQFLINTKSLTGLCSDRPKFVPPTPMEGALSVVKAGDTLTLRIYAYSNRGISSINMVTPSGVSQSSLRPDDMGRQGVNYITVTWTPTASQQGSHILCAQADDNSGKSSDSRCVTVIAWDIDPCDSPPCENNGTCIRNGYTSEFTCVCEAGFTGTLCEIDIDECASQPCQNNATCNDHVNGYTCTCNPGYTGVHCEIDIDECASQPCLNGATCNDHVNGYTCTCQQGYTDTHCETDINECLPEPCGVLYSCTDVVNGYQCKIIPSELAAVVLTSFLTSLFLLLFAIRRKWKKKKLNEWWSQFTISAKPDTQSKTIFTSSLNSSHVQKLTSKETYCVHI